MRNLLLFTLSLLSILPSHAKKKEVILFFETNQFEVPSQEKEKLNNVRKQIPAFAEVKITILATADFRGEDEYNQRLSSKRAESVSSYLTSIGFHEADIYHELKLFDLETKDKNQLQQHRIAHVILEYSNTLGKKVVPGFKVKFSNEYGGSLRTVQGTEVHLPANCFYDPETGYVPKKILLELREFYTPAELMANGLYTVSNRAPLVSGGSVFIEASSFTGRPLSIRPGYKFTLKIPRFSERPEAMAVFEGSKTPNNSFTWDLLRNQNNDTLYFDTTMFPYTLNQTMEWIEKGPEKNREEVIDLFRTQNYNKALSLLYLKYLRAKDDSSVQLLANQVNTHDVVAEAYAERHYIYRSGTKRVVDFKQVPFGLEFLENIDRVFVGEIDEKAYPVLENPDQANFTDEYYTVELSTLGYINCDRFLEEELTPVYVKNNQDSHYDFMLFFPDLFSLLPFEQVSPDGFKAIAPLGREAYVLGLKRDDLGYHMIIEKITIENKKQIFTKGLPLASFSDPKNFKSALAEATTLP